MRIRLLVAVLLLAAACGDDGGGGGRSTVADTAAPVAEARPSAGCETPEPGAVHEEERTLTVGGLSRRYLVTVPRGLDARDPVPLVFDIHGFIEGAEIHTQMSQYSTLAEEEGFVVVFPHGRGNPLRWDVDLDPSANPDLGYFDALLADVTSAWCIDESRIYGTGLSYGSMFLTSLLCTRAEVFAAAAPVSGLLDPPGCDPARAVPLVTFNGTADPILHFNGGVDLSVIPGASGGGPTTTLPPADLDGAGFPANVAAYAERNGCDPEPTDTELTDEVIHRVYDCPEGADVEFYIVLGGGHAWPSSEFSRSIESVVGHTTFDVDGTRDGWAFMSQFTNP
jgi:polyhydroxybutyrate depolymerase